MALRLSKRTSRLVRLYWPPISSTCNTHAQNFRSLSSTPSTTASPTTQPKTVSNTSNTTNISSTSMTTTNARAHNAFESPSNSSHLHSQSQQPQPQLESKWEESSPLPAPKTPVLPGLEGASVQFKVGKTEEGTRLDRYIKRCAPGLPAGLIQRLIRQRKIQVNGEIANRNKYPVNCGDTIRLPGDIKLGFTRGKRQPPKDDVTLSESMIIRSWILHRDARSVVLNKPPGLPVLPKGPSFINPIVLKQESKKPPNERLKLGLGQGPLGTDPNRCLQDLLFGIGQGHHWIIHRLDQDVSGAIVIARDIGAAGLLSEYFKSRVISKTYWALVEGWFKEKEGSIQIPVDGKRAYTSYRLIHRVDDRYAWVELKPRTGRKHQLRIHCAHGLGCPIVGDMKYGLDTHWSHAAAPPSTITTNSQHLSFPKKLQQYLDNHSNQPELRTKRDKSLEFLLANNRNDENYIGDASSTALHLMSRNIQYPILTDASVGAMRRRNHANGSSRDPKMISVTAPLPPHMKDTWKRLGLDEKWGGKNNSRR